MKDSIVERLLTQGHITIHMADTILNDGLEKATILTALREDGIITTYEVVVLLKDGATLNNALPPIANPLPFDPNYGRPDWTYDPHRTGQPWYTSPTYSQPTTTEPFEYSDTKWPNNDNN